LGQRVLAVGERFGDNVVSHEKQILKLKKQSPARLAAAGSKSNAT
jgi:hypothetical protein